MCIRDRDIADSLAYLGGRISTHRFKEMVVCVPQLILYQRFNGIGFQSIFHGNTNVTYVLTDSPLTVEDRLSGLVTFTSFTDTTSVKADEVLGRYMVDGNKEFLLDMVKDLEAEYARWEKTIGCCNIVCK